MRPTVSRLRASQVIDPIVPGMNSSRKVCRRGSLARVRASRVAVAMPEQLSFAIAGWQVWVVMRNSSSVVPGSMISP